MLYLGGLGAKVLGSRKQVAMDLEDKQMSLFHFASSFTFNDRKYSLKFFFKS